MNASRTIFITVYDGLISKNILRSNALKILAAHSGVRVVLFVQPNKNIPANKKYKPIIVNKHDENFKIVGVVVGMIRAMDKMRIDNAVKLKKAS